MLAFVVLDLVFQYNARRLVGNVFCFMLLDVYSGSKLSGRLSRPTTSNVGHSDTDNLSRYRQRHLNERRQPVTDFEDVEPDSDSDIIPPSPVDDR